MRILLTNDDGIRAAGLAALERTVTGLGDIDVVAPDRERSAAGHSLTIDRPLRICREAPVPVVTIARELVVPGGAANTAANVASLGAQTRFLSVVGNDHEGKALRRSLHAAGVPTDDLLIVPGRRTLVKRRILGAGQMLLRVDAGDVEAVNGALERALLERLTVLFEGSDVVIVSDYGYGILTPTLIAGLAVAQRSMPRVLVVDAKDLALYQDAGVTVAKPNYAEALALLGCDPGEQDGQDDGQDDCAGSQLRGGLSCGHECVPAGELRH